MAFGQQAPLDPVFTAIRGVGARLFPPNGALVIAPSILENDQSMPCSSSNCSTPACQSWKKHPPAPTPDTDHAPSNAAPVRSDPAPAIDSRCARRRRWHRRTADPARAADRRRNGACSHGPARGAARPPTRHRRPESRSSFCCFVYGHEYAEEFVLCSCPLFYHLDQLFG